MASRKALINVIKGTIVPVLSHSLIMTSRKQSNLQKLKTIYNKAIRIASGAAISSPIVSVMAEAGQLPAEYHTALTLSSKSINIMANNNIEKESIKRAKTLFQSLTGKTIPQIAKTIMINPLQQQIEIDWSIHKKHKAGQTITENITDTKKLITEKYSNFQKIYTEGKIEQGNQIYSYATNQKQAHKATLPPACSKFTAEAHAIYLATTEFRNPQRKIVIFSNSESCLKAIGNQITGHPTINKIIQETQRKHIQFCWIPKTMIPITNKQTTTIETKTPAKDAKKFIKTQIKQAWQEKYEGLETKLHHIKKTTKPWNDRIIPIEQKILTRLRIGHSKITHNKHTSNSGPLCEACGTKITIKHILEDCVKYDRIREECRIIGKIEIDLNNERENEKKVLKFIRKTKLLKQI